MRRWNDLKEGRDSQMERGRDLRQDGRTNG